MRAPITRINKCGFQTKTQVHIADFSLCLSVSGCLISLTPDSCAPLAPILSAVTSTFALCVSPDCLWSLSVFFLSQAPSGRPPASSSTWDHLQHVYRCGGFTGILRNTRGELFHCSKSIDIY